MMNADQAMRAHSATLPAPTFENPAFVTPPPLAAATVAIVTSAALHTADDNPFTGGDEWCPGSPETYSRSRRIPR